MNYAIVGVGRMGQAVDRVAAERGHRCVARIDVETPLPETTSGWDLAFEFTCPDAAAANVHALVRRGLNVVCGTTGWEPAAELRAAIAASGCGVVLAPNFSVGMNLFFGLVRDAAERLSASGLFDPFVEEAHHRGKRDAPSGTAKRLARILVDSDSRFERIVEGNPTDALPADALQVSSRRAGSEPGAHTVGFDGEHELITVRHAARGREGLALGAVLAAEWLEQREGLFIFEEVLDSILQAKRRRDHAVGAGEVESE